MRSCSVNSAPDLKRQEISKPRHAVLNEREEHQRTSIALLLNPSAQSADTATPHSSLPAKLRINKKQEPHKGQLLLTHHMTVPTLALPKSGYRSKVTPLSQPVSQAPVSSPYYTPAERNCQECFCREAHCMRAPSSMRALSERRPGVAATDATSRLSTTVSPSIMSIAASAFIM